MDAKAFYMAKPWVKFYPEGVPETIMIPEQSVPEIFDETRQPLSFMARR